MSKLPLSKTKFLMANKVMKLKYFYLFAFNYFSNFEIRINNLCT